ncbi:MAG: helix-turn-helix domain-containing protein [Streptosporangiaceae bacterium]
METREAGIQEKVAEEVRVAMARRRMTGRALALRLGWTAPFLSRRLTGDVAFTITELFDVARILDIPLSALIPQVRGDVTSGKIIS